MDTGKHPSPDHLLPRITAIFSDVWLPGWLRDTCKGISPAEDALAPVLQALLWRELLHGRLILDRNARIGTGAATMYQVDFLIHEPYSDARAIIEVDGWSYHRRTSAEFDLEIRREREIQTRLHTPMIRYTAREVLDAPWVVGLEIVDLLGTMWTQFQPVVLPQAVRDLALRESSAAAAHGDGLPRDGANDSVECTPPEAAYIAAEVARLPDARCVRDDALHAIREHHPRAYESWTPREDELLQAAVKANSSLDRLASLFGRQPTAIAARLERLGANR